MVHYFASRVCEGVGRYGGVVLRKIFLSGGEDYTCQPSYYKTSKWGRIAALHTSLYRDISLDCYANYEEGELVEVCIDNMLPEF